MMPRGNEDACFIRPRDSGGGGKGDPRSPSTKVTPTRSVGCGEARWRGRGRWRIFCGVRTSFDSSAPPTTTFFVEELLARSPLPAVAGRDKSVVFQTFAVTFRIKQ